MPRSVKALPKHLRQLLGEALDAPCERCTWVVRRELRVPFPFPCAPAGEFTEEEDDYTTEEEDWDEEDEEGLEEEAEGEGGPAGLPPPRVRALQR